VPRTGLWLRVFVGLLLAVLPPILLLASALLLTDSVFRGADPNIVAVLVVVGSLVWAAILAIVFTRSLADEIRGIVALGERGTTEQAAPAAGTPSEQLTRALEHRNRQVAALAERSRTVAIDADPQGVARELVGAARSVLGDPTWRLAVLTSDSELLAPGSYAPAGEGEAVVGVGETEQWASVTRSDDPARHLEGPWGAFVVTDVSFAGVRGILLAPWEGRTPPSPAEFNLIELVGQHVSTALEHSLLYAQVRSQADELNRLAAVQADFLRGVTHDLQTPLTSIGALATELNANERIPETARRDLETITHQADRLRRMVAQLLVASRLEAGVVTPEQDVFSVQPIIERTWSALRSDRPFDLSVAGPPQLAIGDVDRLEQVLWALLDNAVKYSPAGSPVDVRLEPDGHDRLAISVTDHGMGMDPETAGLAFEQFYRAERARSLAPDGSGVGLYAARGLVEAMGGRIGVESRLGSGTTVRVTLPAEPVTTADQA
jgi:signal transduction histidine kinase